MASTVFKILAQILSWPYPTLKFYWKFGFKVSNMLVLIINICSCSIKILYKILEKLKICNHFTWLASVQCCLYSVFLISYLFLGVSACHVSSSIITECICQVIYLHFHLLYIYSDCIWLNSPKTEGVCSKEYEIFYLLFNLDSQYEI